MYIFAAVKRAIDDRSSVLFEYFSDIMQQGMLIKRFRRFPIWYEFDCSSFIETIPLWDMGDVEKFSIPVTMETVI